MSDRIEYIFDQVAQEISPKKKDITPIKRVLKSCKLQDKSILEVGCGLGDNLIYCLQRGAGYAEGFDISAESIRLAKKKAKDLPNIIFHICSLEDYRTDRKFDFIVAWGVFEYLDNPLQSLEKICCFLADKGTLILLISRAIFLKRITFLCRVILSKIPLEAILPVTKFISKVLRVFSSVFERRLYIGQSNTYSIEQTVLEGLMVPKYNILQRRMFSNYLKDKGFTIEFFNDVAPSVIGIMAKKTDST